MFVLGNELRKGDEEVMGSDEDEIEASPPLPSNRLNSLPDPMHEFLLWDSSASSISSIS